MKEYEKCVVQEMNLSSPFTFLILKSAGGRIHKSTVHMGQLAYTVVWKKISIDVNGHVYWHIGNTFVLISAEFYLMSS